MTSSINRLVNLERKTQPKWTGENYLIMIPSDIEDTDEFTERYLQERGIEIGPNDSVLKMRAVSV